MNDATPILDLDAIITGLEAEFEDLGATATINPPVVDTNTCDTCTCPCSTD